jgi:hypothetical protein
MGAVMTDYTTNYPNFDTNPEAEVAYLKAWEKAHPGAWPPNMSDAEKLKKIKAYDWPLPDAAKKKPWYVPQLWTPPEAEYRAFVQGGIPLGELIRALLILAAALAAALLID